MENTGAPVTRLMSESIRRAFQISGKKHLILTGSRGIGKTALLRELFSKTLPGLTSRVFPQSHVELRDNLTGETAVIGIYPGAHGENTLFSRPAVQEGERMQPVPEGFLFLGISAIHRAVLSDSPWATIDELGYLESGCPEFQSAVHALFEQKRVAAVLRKKENPFLTGLRSRNDVFVFDLDEPVLPVGCVIMASGLGRRFGGNKLMAPFQGMPLGSHIMRQTGQQLFARRVTVTRSEEVRDLSLSLGIDAVLHREPARSDTVRLGLSALQSGRMDLRGCLFCVGDQPLLTRESLETLVLTFSSLPVPETAICRLCFEEVCGNPILFGRQYFEELSKLPKGKGGGILLKKYPDRVVKVSAGSAAELTDVDTREDLAKLEANCQ